MQEKVYSFLSIFSGLNIDFFLIVAGITVLTFLVARYFLRERNKNILRLKYTDIDKDINVLTYVGYLLFFLAFMYVAWLIYQKDYRGLLDLVIPLGTLVAALLVAKVASRALLYESISKENENLTTVRFVFFQLCDVKIKLGEVIFFQDMEQHTVKDVINSFEILKQVDMDLNELKDKHILSVLHNNILMEVHFLFLISSSNRTRLDFILNIFKKSYENQILSGVTDATKPPPEILRGLKVDVEEQIRIIDKVLKYLKSGYPEVFPTESGIEACAEYNYKNPINNLESEQKE